VHPPHSAIAPGASPARCLAGPGQGEKLTQADHGSAIAAGVRPTRHEISRRVFATIPAGAGERQSRAAPHRTSPWAGRSGRGPLARVAGERCRGGGRRLTARNLRSYGYLNRRRRANLIRPAKRPVSRLGEATRNFGMIVRCRGRSSGWLARSRGKPVGRNRPESPAPPDRGHRPACWAPELARSRD
jgi:hypothetical protein